MRRNPNALLVLAILIVTAYPSMARAQDAQLVTTHRHDVRPLLGVGGEGAVFVDRAQGIAGGLAVHAGVHAYGLEIYGLSQGFVGALVAGPRSGNAEGLLWNSAMIGFGVDAFHLAGGPSLDFAWGCDETNALPSCYRGSALLGVDARASLVFSHLALTLDVHPTIYRDATVTAFVLGIGFEL